MSAPRANEIRAGGTDLSERRRSGVSRGEIIDLDPSGDMTRIGWDNNGGACIGAMVTIEALAADARLRQAYPGLAAAAAGLATPQIRAIATVGGNLSQRSRCWYYRNPHLSCLKKGAGGCPARAGNHLYGVAFDLGPCVAPHPSTLGAAFFAYGAVIATDRRGALGIADLFGDGSNGAADNTLGDGERILSIDMGAPLPGERAAYRRAISRARAEWPLVEVVVRAVIGQGRFRFIRVAAGGVAPVPLRLKRVEEALQSAPVDPGAIRHAAAAAITGANPLPQTGYKLPLLREQLIDVLEAVAG
ncbi:MAG: FAD binding domain-containing protein [Stellaceae bacterium]